MFTQTSRIAFQCLVAVLMISVWTPKPAHAATILPDPRELTYICCGAGDPTTTDFKSLDITYPVNVTAATLPTAPAGCQVVTAAMKAIVDCTNKLNKGDKIVVSIDPVNNGNVTACWDPANVCITNATAVPEPEPWLLMIGGFFSLGLLLRLATGRRATDRGWMPAARA